jgi:hypothetical protein
MLYWRIYKGIRISGFEQGAKESATMIASVINKPHQLANMLMYLAAIVEIGVMSQSSCSLNAINTHFNVLSPRVVRMMSR